MPFSDSLAGAAWKYAPALTATGLIGAGVGSAAGIASFVRTPGGFSAKSNAAGSSFAGYGLAGVGIAGVGLAVGGSQYLSRSVGTSVGQGVRQAGSGIRGYAGRLGQELRSAGGWRKTLTRVPVSMGLGASIGALVGAKIDPDHQAHGAMIGAATGAVGAAVVSRGVRAVGSWGKLGTFGKFGVLAAAATAVGAAAHTASPTKYQAEDQPESGVRSRMNTIGATGDLVFGLHNSR